MAKGRRKNKHRSQLNFIVVLLVSAVVAYGFLSSAQERWGLNLGLPEIDIPGASAITDRIGDIVGSVGGARNQSRPIMDNAMLVSAPIAEAIDYPIAVHMLDVGQAESILIVAPEKNVLIDAGDNGQGPMIMRYLQSQGVEEIHILIATHPHADHIGGMSYIMQNMPIGLLIMPDIPEAILPTTRTFNTFLTTIIEMEIEAQPAQPGILYDLGGGADLEILGPGLEFSSVNDMSVISRVTYGEARFLFTGDAERAAELWLAEQENIGADVLSVGHHGSNTSSSQVFLDAVSPQVALISSGIDNSFGHPHRDVISRLSGVGAEIYRTDIHGTVIVAYDGERLFVYTER